jgi:hypothetical protein
MNLVIRHVLSYGKHRIGFSQVEKVCDWFVRLLTNSASQEVTQSI